MIGSVLASALLLLASAMPTAAQTTEGILTVQTSVPQPVDTSCIGDGCLGSTAAPPGTTEGQMSILPITTSAFISVPGVSTGLVSSAEMSIPGGETPISTVTSVVTSILTSATGNMSIPAGETPLSTGSTSGSAGPSSSGSATGSAPPSESTGAAATAFKGDGIPFLYAMTLSGLSVIAGFAWMQL